MEKRFENFTYMVIAVEKIVQKIKTYGIKKYDLKAVHVMCIYHLYQSEKGLNGTELCKVTLEDKGAISRALSLLSEKGYISTSRRDRLGRAVLTEEGKKVAEYINQEATKAVEVCGSDLTDTEREIFYGAFAKITNNLKKYYDEMMKENEENE